MHLQHVATYQGKNMHVKYLHTHTHIHMCALVCMYVCMYVWLQGIYEYDGISFKRSRGFRFEAAKKQAGSCVEYEST